MHCSHRMPGGASIFTKFNTKVSILAFGKNVPTQSSGTWGHKKVYDLLCLLIHSTDTPVSPLWCFYLRTSQLCGEVLSFREEERVERKKGGRHLISWFVTRIVWITTQVFQQRLTNNTSFFYWSVEAQMSYKCSWIGRVTAAFWMDCPCPTGPACSNPVEKQVQLFVGKINEHVVQNFSIITPMMALCLSSKWSCSSSHWMSICK